MDDVTTFAALLSVLAGVGFVAVVSNRLTERVRLPAAVLFLVGAAIAQHVISQVHAPPLHAVERAVTVALVVILFDGGMHLGWGRVRAAAGAIGVVGVLGTFLTAGGMAVIAHLAFGLGWFAALLVGTAIAPTDPAVVFSVLGRREILGRTGAILEGESGANDPVGIALLASLLSAGHISGGALGDVAAHFVEQMAIGAVLGILAGFGILWSMRRVSLPGEGLYSLRTLASVLLVYGVTTLAHGSGFLAVFVAGIVIGDARAPYKREVERFHGALASLGEIVAFVVLGLTVDLDVLAKTDSWVPGLVLGLVLIVVVRPLVVWLCLSRTSLRRGERMFVGLVGLKGAVPILLGTLLLGEHVGQAPRLYAIIVGVVILSVVGQGATVPYVARRCGVPMRTVEPEPWAFGVRLRENAEWARRYVVAPGSPADGCRVADLAEYGHDVWISLVVRDAQLLPVRGDTEIRAGDEVVVLADPEQPDAVGRAFG